MMSRILLGIVLENTGLTVRRGLAAASGMTADSVQVDAVGDLAPDRLTATGRREVVTLLRSHNLALSALNCPLRRGLDTQAGGQERIDHVRAVLRLAIDLGCRAVVVPLPPLPADPAAPGAVLLRDALLDLGSLAARIGTRLALAPGPVGGAAIRAYLDSLDAGGLGVTLDPAGSLLAGFDPLAELTKPAGRIAHVHARDARTEATTGGGRETAIGDGEVDWAGCVAALEAMGYSGHLAVTREVSADRVAALAAGVRALKKLLPGRATHSAPSTSA